MKKSIFLLGLAIVLLLNFSVPFGYAYVARLPDSGGPSVPFPSPPQFNFTPIPVPSLSFSPSWNIVQDVEELVNLIPNFVADFVAVNLTNFFLYIMEAIYYFLAYAEYFIVIAALNASVNLGIWALPAFIGVLTLLVSLVVMLVKVSEGVFLIGGA